MKKKNRGKPSGKRKKKTQIRVAMCPLCKSASGFLLMNKFCKCVMKESDWISKSISLNGRDEPVTMVDPSRVNYLKSLYQSLTPSTEITGRKDSIQESFSEASPVMIHGQKIFFHKEYTTEKRDRFITSNEWMAIRMKVILRDKVCLACGSKEKLQCDHIRPMASHWHLRKDMDNLQLLCKQCNFGKGVQSIDFRGGEIKILDS